jgi:hypothetical protein
MTKQTFTEKFIEIPNLSDFWKTMAEECIEQNNQETFVSLLIDQYLIKGSRRSVEKRLTPELLAELKLFVCDNILGEDHAMRMKLVSKTTKIAELKKIISDQKVVIEQLKKQIH